MKQELMAWNAWPGGIAALSFTKVAGREIENAFGQSPSPPHFVGTIDSFLYRFVVRPFARAINRSWPEPSLLPAEHVPHVSKLKGTALALHVPGSSAKHFESIYDFQFLGESSGEPVFVLWTSFDTRMEFGPTDSQSILSRKKEVWRLTGRLSHSDVAYVAKNILHHPTYGARIRELVCRRFPMLIIDETQDTGFFRSQSLLALLREPGTRAVVVGDPDQAIYGFNGASPALFEQFEKVPDAKVFPVDRTQRCSSAVSAVATALVGRARVIETGHLAGEGKACLHIHDGDADPAITLAGELADRCAGKVAILVRGNQEVRELSGLSEHREVKFGRRAYQALAEGVRFLREGNTTRALADAQAAVGIVLFDTAAPDDDELRTLGLERPEWRSGLVEILFKCEALAVSRSLHEWSAEVKSILGRVLESRGWWQEAKDPRLPRMPHRNKTEGVQWEDYCPAGGISSTSRSFSVQTVHSAKGETHAGTILWVPKTRKDRCPSTQWWPTDPDNDGEEARVAYVAATRSRGSFHLFVHRETFTRLEAEHSDFLELFELEGEQTTVEA